MKTIYTFGLSLLIVGSLSGCDASSIEQLLEGLNTSQTGSSSSGSSQPQPKEKTPSATTSSQSSSISTDGELLVSKGRDPLDHTLSDDEKALALEINQYRQSKGLKPLPVSLNLSFVARTHSENQQKFQTNAKTNAAGQTCNLHSWSGEGKWSSCCYTDDHAQAQCMWDKPRELSAHKGDGFEISLFTSGSKNSPASLLNIWKESDGHNNVILNLDTWKDNEFSVMGIGIDAKGRTYANVWFSESPDP